MRSLENINETYPEDPSRYFKFSRFNKQAGNFLLVAGIFNCQILKSHKKEKIVYIELEDPNRFFSDKDNFNHLKYENYFYKIFTICPYTAEWLNNKYANGKRVSVFFPFNEEYIPKKNKKEFDVIYTGHIHPEVRKIVEIMSCFNYRLVSHSDNEYVTNKSISYAEKIDLISKSKITLVKNYMEVTDKQIEIVNKIKGYQDNYAFKYIPKKKRNKILKKILPHKKVTVPQIKSRVFEAAFSKSLILCQQDKFNVIEKFFQPNKEFVYYKVSQLKDKIKEILINYDKYKPIIENAFQKANSEYTTKIFFNKYLKKIK